MSFIRNLGFTDSSTEAKHDVGTKFYDNTTGKCYLFVQVSASSANACSNGRVMLNTGSFVVSDDISANKRNDVIGIGVGAIAVSSYGWIQTWGPHTAVKTNGDDDIADGVTLICSASTGATYDGCCDSMAADTAATHIIIGNATAADSDTNDTVAAFLRLMS